MTEWCRQHFDDDDTSQATRIYMELDPWIPDLGFRKAFVSLGTVRRMQWSRTRINSGEARLESGVSSREIRRGKKRHTDTIRRYLVLEDSQTAL
jgi:hypothetical protein